MYPYAHASLPFSARKGKNKRKKGKFLRISGDFVGIIREEILALIGEKRKKEISGDFWDFWGF